MCKYVSSIFAIIFVCINILKSTNYVVNEVQDIMIEFFQKKEILQSEFHLNLYLYYQERIFYHLIQV